VRESISENILAGNAMARRASYMFGSLLPKGPKHQVGVGLGQAISTGIPGLLYPTVEVTKTGQKLVVDGIEMEVILALESEAPSEFMFYMPKYKAFCQAGRIIGRSGEKKRLKRSGEANVIFTDMFMIRQFDWPIRVIQCTKFQNC